MQCPRISSIFRRKILERVEEFEKLAGPEDLKGISGAGTYRRIL
jgi:hypothetical protein